MPNLVWIDVEAMQQKTASMTNGPGQRSPQRARMLATILLIPPEWLSSAAGPRISSQDTDAISERALARSFRTTTPSEVRRTLDELIAMGEVKRLPDGKLRADVLSVVSATNPYYEEGCDGVLL